MPFLFFKKKCQHKVTFATACYEKDWKDLLLNSSVLVEMINNNMFFFEKKMLIINNVFDTDAVLNEAKKKQFLTDIIIADSISMEVMSFFQLEKKDFTTDKSANYYEGVDNDWIYYNALAPLSAIYSCKTDYLLYMTGDVRLEKPVDWIKKAIYYLEKYPKCKVANLIWNNKKKEVKAQSYKRNRYFFFAKEGFSDQMFLIKTKNFQKPIYHEIREDASHFPRGDVFEKRVFSYLKNRKLERIIFRKGSYLHEDTPCRHSVKNH